MTTATPAAFKLLDELIHVLTRAGNGPEALRLTLIQYDWLAKEREEQHLSTDRRSIAAREHTGART